MIKVSAVEIWSTIRLEIKTKSCFALFSRVVVSEVFGWSWSQNLFLTTLGVGFFCLTPDVQLDYFLHHTLKLRIPVEMLQFLLKLLLKQIFCCGFLTHNFDYRYASKSIKGSIDADFDLVFNETLSQ